MAHRFAEAFKYGKRDTLPPNYPWELVDQEVALVEDLPGGMTRITLTNRRVFTLPYNMHVRPPMRSDGSTVNWTSHVPLAQDICIGDVVSGSWRVQRIYRLPNASVEVAGIDLRHVDTGELVAATMRKGEQFRVDAETLHRSHRGESLESRSARPSRGPYVDVDRPQVEYHLLVHQSGRGRWPNDVPRFMRRETPGSYESRPPARNEKAIWNILKFEGESDATRHPQDPLYRG